MEISSFCITLLRGGEIQPSCPLHTLGPWSQAPHEVCESLEASNLNSKALAMWWAGRIAPRGAAECTDMLTPSYVLKEVFFDIRMPNARTLAACF